MANELKFEVKLKKADLEYLLSKMDPKDENLYVEGTYTFKGKYGGVPQWDMEAVAKVYKNGIDKEFRPCCPMPCNDDSNTQEQES